MYWFRQREVDALAARYGEVPPQWMVFDLHPTDASWRQGGGESLKLLWWEWWPRQGWGENERLAYFRRWSVPPRWLPFLINAVWGVSVYSDRDGSSPFFERTAALGFGGWADYIRDASDPRWLEQDSATSDPAGG